MKRIIRSVFYIFVCMIALVIMSCDMGQSKIPDENVDVNEFKIEMYKVEKITEAVKVGNSYYKDGIIYHTFKIGTIYNVPAYKGEGFIHEGEIPTDVILEKEEEFGSKYSMQISKCQQYAVSTSINTEMESAIGSKIGYKGEISAEVEAEIKVGLKTSLGINESSSISESKAIEDTYTKRVKTTKQIKIEKNASAGYYSYIILDDLDVYALLACDIDKKEIQFNYLYISKNNVREGLCHYTDKENPFAVKQIEKLDISSLIALNFNFYDKSNAIEIVEPEEPVEVLPERVILIQNGPDPNKVVHDGQYGLEQDIKTEINLSNYEKYMNDNYMFTFTVVISAEAWKGPFGYEQGHKQLFLFKEDPGYVKNSLDVINADIISSHYGLLEDEDWTEDKITKSFVWDVKGSDCTNNMCIKYDAWGNYNDTWYVNGLNVYLTISHK